MSATDIVRKYSAGELTLVEANEKLKTAAAGFCLDPKRNVIAPDEVGRFGLLDTGTGTLDKVEISGGCLVNADVGDMVAFCFFNGKLYPVSGSFVIGL